MDRNKVMGWYEKFCYENKIASDIFDINAEIDSNINEDENINIIEKKLKVLIDKDIKLNENIKEKVRLQKEEQKKREEEKRIEEYKITVKNEMDLIKRICLKSTHIVILGKRREGKTALGFEILRWHKELTNKEILIYRFPKPEILPKWIKNVNGINEIGCNQVVLIDEASNDLDQYSYQKQSNRFLAQLLKRAGQTGTSFIFIDHNSGFINKNMLRMIDIWILKKNTEFAVEDERKYIKQLYKRMLWEPKIEEYFVHCDEYEGILKYKMPDFYTEGLSKGYDIETKEIIDSSDLIGLLMPKNANASEANTKMPKNAKGE